MLIRPGPWYVKKLAVFNAVKHTHLRTDTSTPHLRGQSRPRIFGAQFAELAGKVCDDEAVPGLVALMEENRKVIGKVWR
jgi:hypothetical protein